jgi:sialate O-acetylesterase
MKKNDARCRAILIVLAVALTDVLWMSLPTRGDVRPHSLISDGMVLQRDRAINVWGMADRGEMVTVRFRGRESSATTGDDGQWRVQLETQQAGGPFPLTIAGKNTIALSVWVGDVWVCSGQSNMWWPVATRPRSRELIGTENPSMRLFTVPERKSDVPQRDVEGQWLECGPESLVGFSAVAYYFGREIQTTQKVPVGLVHSSFGGSGIEAWISTDAFAQAPELADVRERNVEAARRAAQSRIRLQPVIDRYEAAVVRAKRDGTPPPEPPRGMIARPSSHGHLHNGMIAPLQLLGIRGVLWYQGEANTHRADDYQSLLTTLIHSWRREWGQDEFPFLVVQLAPFQKIVTQPQDSDWARLREAQLRTSLAVPKTGLAVITDWGHETDIHVKQKRPVGERVSLVARSLVYGERLVHSGPQLTGMKIDGRRAILSFDHVGSGLSPRRLVLENVVKDSRSGLTGGALHVAHDENSTVNVPLQGFTVAGDDRRFVTAQAEIHGDTVIVQSPMVSSPVAVRYGWADYPTGNLFNVEGLPASPFRTDDWPKTSAR